MPTFAAFLLFLLCFHCAVADRRILHQPFFAGESLPQGYSPPPSVYPFPASDSQPDSTPFFPSDTSAPPPPPLPATFASFPANVSSASFPHSQGGKSPSSKLIAAAVAAVVAAVVVVSVAVFLQVRKKSGGDRSPSVEQVKIRRSDGDSPHRPPDRLPLPKLQRPSQTSSEFLYLGTLVNSHGGGGGFAFPGANDALNDDSHIRRMESPELQPLPPLNTRQNTGRNYRSNADAATGDDDEEFYSPRDSVNGVESNIGTGSSSRRAFSGVRVENLNVSTSNSSSIYSSTTASGSASGSPGRSGSLSLSPERNPSPGNSIPKSPELIEIQNIAPLRRQTPRTRVMVSQGSASPSPPSSSSPGGYSRRSDGSSPRVSTSSDTNMEAPITPNYPSNPTLPANHPVSASLPPPTPPAFPILPPPPPPPPFKATEFLREKMPALNRKAVETSLSVELPSGGSRAVENNFKKESPLNEMELPAEEAETDDHMFSKPKLKPLHWDKVRASSDRKMVWDQLKCSSFKLNEEMIETLFVANAPNATPKKPARWQAIPPPWQESDHSVLDPKKAQNIAILLKALNVTVDEVCEGLMEGNVETLGADLLEGLLKMAPTKEEERKLKEYNDASSPSKLGAAERFLKAIIDIPYAFKRAEAMIYVSNFESEVEYLRKSCSILEAACEELRTSRMFLKILEAVLKTGNRMNVGTNRGDAHAFKLDTLLKLVDVKGADGKTTLLHFVVQEIIRSEGARLSDRAPCENSTLIDDAKCKKIGLRVVSGLGSELSNVKKAATMDSEVLSGDLFKLSKGLGSIHEVVRLISASSSDENSSHKFCDSMSNFMKRAEEDIIRVQAQESVALSLVKEITEYFHGNSAKEEAHPFRIFMVVRDFLAVLDRVCKEVGIANDRTVLSAANKFPVPVNPMLQQQISFAFQDRKLNSSLGDEGP